MCLDKITEQYDKPSNLIVDGVKVFHGSGNNPEFENVALKGSKTVPLDQWLKAESKPVVANDGKTYHAGFHVYEDEEQAKKYYGTNSRRVYMRKIHTKGIQSNTTVLVADEIYVCSDPNGWPPKSNEPPKRSLKDKILGKEGGA